MKYQITKQKMSIGWKEWDEYGKPSTSIVEYDSLIDLFKGEDYYDEDEEYDEENPDAEYTRMVKAIEEDGWFMTRENYNTYWEDPEPCDSYLTYGMKHYITLLTDEALAKIQAVKDKANAAEITNNKKKWDDFMKEHEGTSNGDLLETLIKEYQFPSKLKKLV